MVNSIRNFCILAHIDHGKSTLADRFLELTGTIPKNKMREQYLDMMDLERERGITIKMQPVRMLWHSESPERSEGPEYILNLIDTPGHVDFTYEVSRALAAVEGAVLLIDATKGVQAQTLANLELARKQGLVVIPVINKIDMANARIQETSDEVAAILDVPSDGIIKISAKNGTNVELILEAVIAKVPPPKENTELPLRALIFDSQYDKFQGIIAYVRVVDGDIRMGEQIYLIAGKSEGFTKETGYFTPELSAKDMLAAGEIGYIATGIKEANKVKIGDTIISAKLKPQSDPSIRSGVSRAGSRDEKPAIKPLPGYKEPTPVVFASFYPEDVDNYDELKDALIKLKLNDPSFVFEPESREGLGRGFRCGFLGTLHMEIISERVSREFGIQLVVSSPSATYKIITTKGEEKIIYCASDWLEPQYIKETMELWADLEILSPQAMLGRVMDLLGEFSGIYKERKMLGDKALIHYEMPLREMLRDFYGRLKSISQGYASMSYEIIGWRKNDLVKLEILVANKKEEAFSQIASRGEAYDRGRALVRKLKEILPAQQFAVALQDKIGRKIIARETMGSRGKDVIAPLYGGDYTRKRKLLEKQKKGKKALKQKGEVRIPQKVFIEIVKETK